MRVATFNLESLDLPPKAAVALEERIAVLRPQLLRLEADVLCLQEVNGQRQRASEERRLIALDRLLEGTPYAGFERAVTHAADGRGVADVHNLVVLSRLPITGTREILHDLVEAPRYRCATSDPPEMEAQQIRWDRPVLETVLKLTGGRALHLFNVHLRAPLATPIAGQKQSPFVWRTAHAWAEGFFLAALKRSGQALELRLAIDAILDRDADALIAVCGDLNAEDHETPLRIALAAEEDTGSGRLARRALVALERSVPRDRRFTVLHHGRPQMLDHILVSHTLLGHFRQLEIHNEALSDELVGFARVDRPPESFHAPVVAEFSF